MSGFEKPPRGRRLCPCRRAVDCAAVRPDRDYVGKLALRRNVAGDVCVVCRHSLKMFGYGFSWVEYKHGFPKFAAECENRSCLIGVSGYQREAVSVGMHGVDKGCDRKIYVGSFFFKFHNRWGADPAKRAFYRAFRDLNPLNDLGSGSKPRSRLFPGCR